ncbi:MAG: hypothetical protein ACKO1M_07600 [Planctomycetota bacterium]
MMAFSRGSLAEQFDGPVEQPGTVVIGVRQPGHKSDDAGEFVEPFGVFSATASATLGGACRKCFVFST